MQTRKLKQALKRFLLIAGVPALLAALYFGGLELFQRSPMLNFEVVAPGRLLRSAQPRPGDLDHILQTQGLGTIISLRGSEEPEVRDWAQKHGVALLSMQMWADHPPTPAQVGLFFDIMRGDTVDVDLYNDVVLQRAGMKKSTVFTFPFPALLHCEGGSDRTGVMVALYRMAFQGWGAKLAEDDMTAHFHITALHPDQFKFIEQVGPSVGPTYGSRSPHLAAHAAGAP